MKVLPPWDHPRESPFVFALPSGPESGGNPFEGVVEPRGGFSGSIQSPGILIMKSGERPGSRNRNRSLEKLVVRPWPGGGGRLPWSTRAKRTAETYQVLKSGEVMPQKEIDRWPQNLQQTIIEQRRI